MGLRSAVVLARGGPVHESEREVLRLLEQELPAPHRVWSSVTISTPDGRWLEIDLIVLGHHGVYVVEVKAHRGRVTGRDRRWVVTGPDGSSMAVESPLPLTRERAKLFARLLGQEIDAEHVSVEPIVVLPRATEIDLPRAERAHVLTSKELLRAALFGELPGEPAMVDREPLDALTADGIQRVVEAARGRAPPRRGRLHTELPLLIHDIALNLEAQAKQPARRASLAKEHDHEHAARKTGPKLGDWIRARCEDEAAALVLSCGFVRALEERGLLPANRLAGEGAEEAEHRYLAANPASTAADYLMSVVREVASHPAGEAVLGERQNPLWRAPLDDDDARALLAFFRQCDSSGRLRWSFAQDRWLDDSYQDASDQQRDEHAMLVTPEFVDDLLLDRALDPALDELGIDVVRVLDPACGSGLLLRMAFEALHDRARRAEPHAPRAVSAAGALDRIHGADISPIAVVTTRVRLVLAYLDRAGFARLADAPPPPLHVVAADALLAGTGDAADEAGAMLAHRYEVIVTEPPAVTPRDAARRDLYRARYPNSARGMFSLVAPFVERCFELATDGGFVGLFCAQGFMKREYGKLVVERVLADVDLSRIVDLSGAYIPGRGMPMALLIGRRRPPSDGPVRVLSCKRGEPILPAEPARGEVWSTILAHRDSAEYEDAYIAIADVPRARLAHHPWTLDVGAASEVMEAIERAMQGRVRDVADTRRGSSSGQDNVFVLPPDMPARLGLEAPVLWPHLRGSAIEDWMATPTHVALAPGRDVDSALSARDGAPRWLRFLWPYRTHLQARPRSRWWAWSNWQPPRDEGTRLLGRRIASTPSFVLDHGSIAPGVSVSMIEFRSKASLDDLLALLAYLNSSTACHWLKRTSVQAMTTCRDGRDIVDFYDLAQGIRDLPIPRAVLAPGRVREQFIALARRLDRDASARAACAPERVLAAWDRGSRDELVEALAEAQMGELSKLRSMVCAQEDVDWLVYEALGLVDDALGGAPGSALPEHRPFAWRSDAPPVGLDKRLIEPWARRRSAMQASRSLSILETARNKRPFRLSSGAGRLHAIEDEAPEEPPERREISHGENFRRRIQIACEGWLLDRIEDVLRDMAPPRCISAGEIAARLEAVPGTAAVMSLYVESARDTTAMARTLLDAHAVPYLAAMRHTEAGLTKRSQWEQVWAEQRRSDAGEDVEPHAPPLYDRGDYRDAVTWLHRGKLDVPTERFIVYPGAALAGDEPCYGWAGWTTEQRAHALSDLLVARETDPAWTGSPRIVPLLAGICEVVLEAPSADEDLRHLRLYAVAEAATMGLSELDLADFRPGPQHRKKKRGDES